MASKVIFPFNHQPAATSRGTTGVYTCPAGMYAKVLVCFSGSFTFDFWTLSGAPTSHSGLSISNGGGVWSQEFWLASGETLDLTATSSNASTAITNSTLYAITLDALSELTVTHSDGNVADMKFYANAAWMFTTSGSGNSGNFSITASADFFWYATEYNELT
jgi:hypothetical protein